MSATRIVRALVTALALAAIAGAAPARAVPAGPSPAPPRERNTCLDCHRDLEPQLAAPARGFAQDIHAQRGLGCVGCHGGDPNDPDVTAMDPDKGFRGPITHKAVIELCASCHSDAAYMKRWNPQPYVFSMAEFRTSVHWKRTAAGDTRAAVCTSCHGVHGILPPEDPRSPVHHRNVPSTCAKCHNAEYMRGRTLPTNQYALYRESVHGRALLGRGDPSAPACNDCHGNHGATPPEVSDISVVCGRCHGREGELFEKSKVGHALELEGKRGCVTCHGNHGIQRPSDGMLSEGEQGICHKCHEPGSASDLAATTVVRGFNEMKVRISHADSLLDLADRLGMETGQGRGLLKEASDQLVTVRSALHSFDARQIGGVLVAGADDAEKAVERGREALRDWRNRRLGMAISLIVILGVIGLLVLKIRQIERR